MYYLTPSLQFTLLFLYLLHQQAYIKYIIKFHSHAETLICIKRQLFIEYRSIPLSMCAHFKIKYYTRSYTFMRPI